MFARLIDSKKFQQTIFPGLSPDARKTAPKTLMELLENPLYEKEMAEFGIPAARQKAQSVLENVKRKGAKEGQYMDAATEANLWPQIMQEAIAHQVVEVVNRVHKREHGNKGISAAVICAVACAMDINKIHSGESIPINEQFLPMVDNILGPGNALTVGGSSDSDSEDDDCLPEESLIGLLVVPGLPQDRMEEIQSSRSFDPTKPGDEGLSIGSGWFVIDDFFGEEGYAALGAAIKSDCRRMRKKNRMTPIPVLRKVGDKTPGGGILDKGHGMIAWVSDDEFNDQYAAV